MIAHINGILIYKTPETIIIDVGGVGYELLIPLSTFYLLPELNQRLSLQVHTQVSDDAIRLFGFLTREEKGLFQLLISVTGIGPKLARNILSGIGAEDLVSAISSSDRARLNTIPGVGAKSAERLILELKDKVKGFISKDAKTVEAPSSDALSSDVVSALENLGYKNVAAVDAVKKAKTSAAAETFEAVFKESLKLLSKK